MNDEPEPLTTVRVSWSMRQMASEEWVSDKEDDNPYLILDRRVFAQLHH